MRIVHPDKTKGKWVMMHDGAFLCPACVAKERNLILQAQPGVRGDHQWLILGVCGHKVGGRVVNDPDQCANCYVLAPEKKRGRRDT